MIFSLDKLNKIVGSDLTAQETFVRLFVSEMLEKELPKFKLALKEKNSSSLHKCAHNIKSNSKFFGLDEIASNLQKIEDQAENHQSSVEFISLSKKSISDLEFACLDMKTWLKELSLTE